MKARKPFGGSAECKLGEILIWAILQPLLTVTEEGCINLDMRTMNSSWDCQIACDQVSAEVLGNP